MTGLAAELRGARLWMNVEIAIVVCETGIAPHTWSRSHTKNGLQHRMNTESVAIEIRKVGEENKITI